MSQTTSGTTGQLKSQLTEFTGLLGQRAVRSMGDRITDLTERLEGGGAGPAGRAVEEGVKNKAEGGSVVGGALKGAAGGLKDKVKDAIPGLSSGGGAGGDQGGRVVNIVETLDVGVPLSLAYNAWTDYHDWPSFMRKVEHGKQEKDDTKVEFKAQIFLSHRRWTASLLEQVPDERIVWRSTGEKGHVDGAVTFHEIGPSLTRILVVLEYHPQGFFEKTGNLWRAQGRRARSDFKHFRRHVMINVIQDPDSVEGWRGVVHDGEVVRTHDEVVEEEQQRADEERDDELDEGPEGPEGAEGSDPEGEEYDEDEDVAEDEYEDEVPDDEPDDEPEDEYDDEVVDDEVADDEVADDDAGEPEEEYEEDVSEDEDVPEDDREPEEVRT